MTKAVRKARAFGDIDGLVEVYWSLGDQTDLTKEEVIDIAFDPELSPEIAAQSILELEDSSGVSDDECNGRANGTQQITEIANAIHQFQRTGDPVVLCTTIKSVCNGLDASNEDILQHATNPEQDPYDSAELIWINAEENTVDDYDDWSEPVKQPEKQTIKFRNIRPKTAIEGSPRIANGHSAKTYRLISEDPSRQPIYERDIRKEHLEACRTPRDEQMAIQEKGILSQPQHPVQTIASQKSPTDLVPNTPVAGKVAMPPPTTSTNTMWGISMPTQRATRLAQDFGLDPRNYQLDCRARSVSPRRITKGHNLENECQRSPSGSRRSRSTNGTGMQRDKHAKWMRCPFNPIASESSPVASEGRTLSQVVSPADILVRPLDESTSKSHLLGVLQALTTIMGINNEDKVLSTLESWLRFLNDTPSAKVAEEETLCSIIPAIFHEIKEAILNCRIALAKSAKDEKAHDLLTSMRKRWDSLAGSALEGPPSSVAGHDISEAHRGKAITPERAVSVHESIHLTRPDYPVSTPGVSATRDSWPSLPKHWSDIATAPVLQDKRFQMDSLSEDSHSRDLVLDSPRPLYGDRKRIPSMSYESSPSKRVKPLVAGKVCQDPVSSAWLSTPVDQPRLSEDSWNSKVLFKSLLGYIEDLPVPKLAYEVQNSKTTPEQGSRYIGQQHKVIKAPARTNYYETRGPVGYRKAILFSVSKLLMQVL